MKFSISLYPVIVILAAIIFFGSDIASAPIGEFGDVSEKVPKFQSIPCTENVTILVEYYKDRSYFNIHMEHSDPGSDVTVDLYHGWSFLKNTPIQPDGTGVSWSNFV
jgi:hypothetical protein